MPSKSGPAAGRDVRPERHAGLVLHPRDHRRRPRGCDREVAAHRRAGGADQRRVTARGRSVGEGDLDGPGPEQREADEPHRRQAVDRQLPAQHRARQDGDQRQHQDRRSAAAGDHADLSVVWSWKLFDHVPPPARARSSVTATPSRDEAAGFVYYNCRYLGLFKIDKASGDIVWRLGGSYDKTSLGAGDFTYAPTSGRFSDAHDPEMHADGTLLLYDNGGFSGVGGTNQLPFARARVSAGSDRQDREGRLGVPGHLLRRRLVQEQLVQPLLGRRRSPPNGNILITAAISSTSASSAHSGGHARGQGGLGDHDAGEQRRCTRPTASRRL